MDAWTKTLSQPAVTWDKAALDEAHRCTAGHPRLVQILGTRARSYRSWPPMTQYHLHG